VLGVETKVEVGGASGPHTNNDYLSIVLIRNCLCLDRKVGGVLGDRAVIGEVTGAVIGAVVMGTMFCVVVDEKVAGVVLTGQHTKEFRLNFV
jgi:hypothetical protein